MHEGMRTPCNAFGESDPAFDGDNGMMVSVWGPPLWLVLHIMTFNYPVQPSDRDRRHYRRFFRLLRHVLPCGACRRNLKRNLATCPLTDQDLADREALSRWLHRLHTCVNRSLGKPEGADEDYCSLRTFCEHFRARCGGGAGQETGCVLPAYGAERAWTRLQVLPESLREAGQRSICMHDRCVLRRRDAGRGTEPAEERAEERGAPSE